jgi:hypothetical protein
VEDHPIFGVEGPSPERSGENADCQSSERAVHVVIIAASRKPYNPGYPLFVRCGY